MTGKFKAVVVRMVNDKPTASLDELTLDDLPDEDVLIDVAYSTLNYKDALAVTGKGKICRALPMVCGIDLAGTVVESKDASVTPGSQVLINGYGLSETRWGGYSPRQRVNSSWLVPMPEAFSLEQAMGIGTAGYTAMLCVLALEDHGVKPSDGPIIVTGASGGVGSVAVMLLAKLGFNVVASTGRVDTSADFLRGLGATELIPRKDLARSARPLESERWAGAVDCVGGDVLATVLAQTRYGGIVTACGLAGGIGIPTTVMPFILRNVLLHGVDSVQAPHELRIRAWKRLAELVDPNQLQAIYQVRPMSQVIELAEELLAGRVRGRIVIDVNG